VYIYPAPIRSVAASDADALASSERPAIIEKIPRERLCLWLIS